MPEPIEVARATLTFERRRVVKEILDYPRPISGCDAQFNHLLDIRRRLERATAELNLPEPIPTSRWPD